MNDQPFIVAQEDITSGKELPPNMIDDLLNVATATFEDIQIYSEHIRHTSGILSESGIRDIAEEYFDNAGVASGVANALLAVQPRYVEHILALLDKWRQYSEIRVQKFSDEKFVSLQKNLRGLVQEYPALSLLRKANQLLRANGNELDDVIFLCDLRPVFDKNREHLEGFVALANMKLQFIRQNGDRDAFELALTHEELVELQKRIDEAIQKLNILKATVKNVLD